jgi:hypothetical protein
MATIATTLLVKILSRHMAQQRVGNSRQMQLKQPNTTTFIWMVPPTGPGHRISTIIGANAIAVQTPLKQEDVATLKMPISVLQAQPKIQHVARR